MSLGEIVVVLAFGLFFALIYRVLSTFHYGKMRRKEKATNTPLEDKRRHKRK